MKLTGYPRETPMQRYRDVISAMLDKLKGYPEVVSIYQIGSVSQPGISDIDFFVVFRDSSRCSLNPLEGLSKQDRYLVTHGLFGSSVSHFAQVQRYSFFHNYSLLSGDEQSVSEDRRTGDEIAALKRQIALEYIIKMYIEMQIEAVYGIHRMRGLLLHVKGIIYDLEFMGIADGPVHDLATEFIEWRKKWFSGHPQRRKLRQWLKEFNSQFDAFTRRTLEESPIFLPDRSPFQIARNVTVIPSNRFVFSHSGVVLPSAFGGVGKKYFNIQHRFNRFGFEVPSRDSELCDIVDERFNFLREMKSYNRSHIPYFTPAISSLPIL